MLFGYPPIAFSAFLAFLAFSVFSVRRLLAFTLVMLALPALADTSAIPVRTEQAYQSPLIEELTLHGTITARLNSDLSLATDGLVSRLSTDIGDTVRKGDLLLELDEQSIRKQLQEIKARRQSAATALSEAARKAEEAAMLHKKKHIAQNELTSLLAARDIARSELEAVKAEEARIQHQLSQHKLYAPFDGVITARHTEIGEWITRSQQAFTLISLNEVLLDVQLPQEYYTKASRITRASILPDTAVGSTIPARLHTLLPASQQKSRTLLARFSPETTAFSSQDSTPQKTTDTTFPLLLPGTTARALIQFSSAESMVMISRDALVHHADDGLSVFVVHEGKANRRSVTTGQVSGNQIQVLSGLSGNETVVVRGNESLREGADVIIRTQD